MVKPNHPAFPNVPDNTGEWSNWDSGMTLRQYAAIKAMQGILASNVNDNYSYKLVVKNAIEIADALLLELDREPDNQEDKLSEVPKQ